MRGGGNVTVRVRIVATGLCVLALIVSAQAQPVPKTAVTGVPPFELGTPMSTVLGATPALRLSTEPCEPQGPTKTYAGKVAAPIGGYPYTADVLLCFYQGNLAAIRLTWPSTTFRASVEDWRSSAKALARQLATSYAPGLIKRNFIDDSIGGRIEIRDSDGNMLTMTSNATDGDTLSIMLWYVAASYDRAVHGQPTAVGPY
jgi:hypothetical protein